MLDTAEVKNIKWEELNKRTDKYIIVSLLDRPGARLFFSKLEYSHYPPRSDRNNLYEFVIGKWQDMIIVAALIPIEEKHLALEVAASIGLEINEDQVLLCIDHTGTKEHPAAGQHIGQLSGTFKGDEDVALEQIFSSDRSARREYIHANIRMAYAAPQWYDSWLGQMQRYLTNCPMFVRRAVETRPEIVCVFIAHLENEYMGCISICRRSDDRRYVGVIHVHKDSRRLGVAQILLRQAISHCTHAGTGRLIIQSNHEYVTKILRYFPEEAQDFVEAQILGETLSIEQKLAESHER